MSDPKLDKTLEQFLTAQSEDRGKGYTLPNLFIRLESYERRLRSVERRTEGLEDREGARDERIEEAHDRLDAHRVAIVSVKRHLRQQPSTDSPEFRGQMDTGSFDLVAIQRQVDDNRHGRHDSARVRALEAEAVERKETATWWKRHMITVISGIAAGLTLTLITVIITLAATQATSRPALPSGVQSGQK